MFDKIQVIRLENPVTRGQFIPVQLPLGIRLAGNFKSKGISWLAGPKACPEKPDTASRIKNDNFQFHGISRPAQQLIYSNYDKGIVSGTIQ